MRGLTATGVIIVVTAAISLAVTLGGYNFYEVIMRAGFIPARLSGVPTDYWAVPVWLTPLSAALIHSGAKSTGEYAWNHPETDWLEDDVFIELQQRRRLFEMYGELGFFRDDMKAWLDALWAGYLDRNGYDTEPTVAEINAKRAEYARVVEEENAESAAIRR